jgi:beta-lactamase class A
MQRRQFAQGLVAAGLMPAAGLILNESWASPTGVEGELAALEAKSGGRLGVCLLDTATGRMAGHRLDERFPMCSTFKALLVGQVLHRVDRGDESLARRVAYGKADLQDYAPTARAHVAEGALAVAQLCEAAVTLSDNTAANLLLAASGGPSALTAFLRSIGDETTRLDRVEPALNVWRPGEVADTSTPRAMSRSLAALAVGDALAVSSRAQLQAWLRATKTGDQRLRAGLPAGWGVGDKTGTWSDATKNDVAVVWPPQGAPWIVTAFLCSGDAKRPVKEATLAEVGRVSARSLAARDAGTPGALPAL